MRPASASAPTANVELREQFLQLLRSLSTISALTDVNFAAGDQHQLLDAALRILIKHQDMERCSIFLVDDGELRCFAGASFSDLHATRAAARRHSGAYSSVSFRYGQGVIGLAAESGEMQYCADCSKDPRFEDLPDALGRPSGSLLATPIIHDGEVLGVINAYHPKVNRFQDWHRNLLKLFARVLGQILANHLLVANLEQTISERTRKLEQALQETELLKQRYEALSTVDELTGLYNRRYFQIATDKVLARAVRYQHPLCLMIMDLDFFKDINDTYGHNAGDRTLQGVARILSSFTRDGDVLARLGGEEFVLALPNTGCDGAVRLAQRICAQVGQHRWQEGSKDFRLTLSIGVTCLLDKPAGRTTTLEELSRQADKALYYVKYHGRDGVACYNELPQEPPASQQL